MIHGGPQWDQHFQFQLFNFSRYLVSNLNRATLV
jgi:hypothetical protein